jgi:hypothetical protein
MKQVFTLFFLLVGIAVFSQQKQNTEARTTSTTTTTTITSESKDQTVPVAGQRTAASSSQTRTSAANPVSYDVNDPYLGRKAEFLKNLTVPELPVDFPTYQKQWSYEDYNQVVDAYYKQHKEILTEKVKARIAQIGQ